VDRAPPIRCALRSHRVCPGHAVFRAWCRHFVFLSCTLPESSGRGGGRRVGERVAHALAFGWRPPRRHPRDGRWHDRHPSAVLDAIDAVIARVREHDRGRRRPSDTPLVALLASGMEAELGLGRARAPGDPCDRERPRAMPMGPCGYTRGVTDGSRRHRPAPRRPSRAAPHPTDDLSDAPELDTTDPHYSRTSNRFSAKANAARPPPSLPHRTQWHPSHTRRRLTRPRRRPAHPPAPRGVARPRRITRAGHPRFIQPFIPASGFAGDDRERLCSAVLLHHVHDAR
jgi:hypothetical protein